MKHNFFSSPPVFQDDLGTLQKNYGFASTATPNWKFKHQVIAFAAASPAPSAGQKGGKRQSADKKGKK